MTINQRNKGHTIVVYDDDLSRGGEGGIDEFRKYSREMRIKW